METGPILGILSIPRSHSNTFMGGQKESFAEILQIAEKMNCTAFVFGPFDIDWSRQAVLGYRYRWAVEPGEWERHLFPLPSVIYNRIPNRTLEKRDDVSDVLARLQQKYGPRLFNPYFLDKWQTHQILLNDTQTKGFLPETHLLDRPEVIGRMVEKHGAVYLKPSASSLGNDMIRVSRSPGGRYHFVHQCLNQENREGTVTNPTHLLELLPQSEEPIPYLVQQAVSLARFADQPFDLRLLVQKDGEGKWRKTGMAARVAGQRSITTHVFYGGSRGSAREAIRAAALLHRFSDSQVLIQLANLVRRVPVTIEKAFGHRFGELEMDLGIDTAGRVWFFETNSKPFRFDEKLIRAKSLVRLIHYVTFLDRNRPPRPKH